MNRTLAREMVMKGYYRNQHGKHSKQEGMLKFYNTEESNEVLKILRSELGEKYNRLAIDQRINGEYKERFYYLPEESECIGHHEIKNYLAHGYIPMVENPDLIKEEKK